MHTHLKKLNTKDIVWVGGEGWTRKLKLSAFGATKPIYKSNSLKRFNLDNLKCLLFVSTCASTTNTCFSLVSTLESINLLEAEYVVAQAIWQIDHYILPPFISTSTEELLQIPFPICQHTKKAALTCWKLNMLSQTIFKSSNEPLHSTSREELFRRKAFLGLVVVNVFR